VVGSPCSGKTTICKRLARHYQFLHIDIHDVLREVTVHDWTDADEIVPDITETAHLISRNLILAIILKRILQNVDSCRGFLLDGFPRVLEQADEFEDKVGHIVIGHKVTCRK
jgi:adenylate kinase